MKEVMYDFNSVVIVSVLFVTLIAVIEGGYHLGRRAGIQHNDAGKAQINTIQGSLLGVLALLLGFTFSLALQRYDSRSQAVVNEANAIGTTLLRAELLPLAVRSASLAGLREYLDLRVQASAVALSRQADRERLLARSGELQKSHWQLADLAATENPNPVTTGLYIQALNEMIDSFASRDAALDRHVPEVVLFLLFATFLLTASLVGYASGVSGHRASFATYILVVLIVFLVFIVIDLDRPRRGLIEVSQQSLIDLQASNRPD
jgi:hypothetical protein